MILMTKIVTNVSLLGDYNYHADAEANVYSKTFFSLERFGLKNPVEMETHIKGNIFNLVIKREIEFLPMVITTDTIVTTDYVAVVFGIGAPKALSENKAQNLADENYWISMHLKLISLSDIH